MPSCVKLALGVFNTSFIVEIPDVAWQIVEKVGNKAVHLSRQGIQRLPMPRISHARHSRRIMLARSQLEDVSTTAVCWAVCSLLKVLSTGGRKRSIGVVHEDISVVTRVGVMDW